MTKEAIFTAFKDGLVVAQSESWTADLQGLAAAYRAIDSYAAIYRNLPTGTTIPDTAKTAIAEAPRLATILQVRATLEARKLILPTWVLAIVATASLIASVIIAATT